MDHQWEREHLEQIAAALFAIIDDEWGVTSHGGCPLCGNDEHDPACPVAEARQIVEHRKPQGEE